MFDREEFEKAKRENAAAQVKDARLQQLALDFVVESDKYNYGYQWTWLGLPIIQLPADILVMQEIIWKNKPDVIIETGIAWGGSVVLYASILELIGKGKVVCVEKVLPEKNRREIMKYSFSHRIKLYEGSSLDPEIVSKVKAHIKEGDSVMVLLDSNHTHAHVLSELRCYAPMVTVGQSLVVSDTILEVIPEQTHRPRPWGPGNNPKTAIREFLKETEKFQEDDYSNNKLLTTYLPGGYLRCIK